MGTNKTGDDMAVVRKKELVAKKERVVKQKKEKVTKQVVKKNLDQNAEISFDDVIVQDPATKSDTNLSLDNVITEPIRGYVVETSDVILPLYATTRLPLLHDHTRHPTPAMQDHVIEISDIISPYLEPPTLRQILYPFLGPPT